MSGCISLRALSLGALCGTLLVGTPANAQDAPPPMTSLAPGNAERIGDTTVVTPVDGQEAWAAWRSSAGYPPVSIANVELDSLLSSLPTASPEQLQWERALLATEVRLGSATEWEALHWLEVLDERDPQTIVWTALYVEGSAAALLPPTCMPSEPSTLLHVVAAERPAAYRDGSGLEAPPSLPGDDAIRSAVGAPGGAATAASLSFVSSAFRGVGLPSFEPTEGCDPALVLAAANLGSVEREDWARIEPALDTLFSIRSVPHNLLRRAAVHWYLDTRPTAIHALVEYAEEASPAERAMLSALAYGASGDGARMAAAIDGVELPDDPYATWIRAEAARQTGAARSARDLATAAVDADPFFASAYLTRASANIALGTPNEGLRDLEHLRRTFGENPTYSDWIAALSRRLR